MFLSRSCWPTRRTSPSTVWADGAEHPLLVSQTAAVPLQIPDEVMVVTIRPTESISPNPVITPTTPTDIQANTTNTSAELSWLPTSDADAYWVRCDGRDMGQAPPPGPDGKIRFRQNRLLPATTYPYQIVATSRTGGVSTAANVDATTQDKLPDLIISHLELIPRQPQPGQTVSFQATVANRGEGPTEDGVTIGVTFWVDGRVVCWSDNDNKALLPGQDVTVKADNGPNSATAWTATPGSHRIMALVDDVNRIAESDKSNNSFVLDLSVPGRCRRVNRRS